MGMRLRSVRRLPDGLVVLCLTLCQLAPVEGVPGHHTAKKAGTAAAVAASQSGRGLMKTGGTSLGGAGAFVPFKSAWPNAEKYEQVDHSHNWCPIKEKILKGEVSFKDALRGQNVSILLATQDTPVSVIYNQTSRMIMGGLPVEVFQDIARRAGFHFKHSMAVVDYIDRSENETDLQWLSWGTQHYDVIDWFTITPDRSRKGFRFAYPFINNSPHLVGQLEMSKESVWDRYLACFSPFSFRLWAMILVGFFLSAIVYVSIEAGSDDIPQKTPIGGTGQAFFLTICQFTGGGGFAPTTPAGKLFVMSVSFLVMLLVTAYTANLASEMITDKVAHAPIQSVDDAVARRLPICVRKGSPFFRMMSRRHPDVQLFQVNTEEDKYPAVMRGDCIAAITGQTWWEFESRMKQFNPLCKLYTIGRNLLDMQGSFVAQATSSTCKEVVIDVMTFTMHQMYLEGYLDQIKDVYIQEFEDISCPSRHSIDDSQKMEPRHMFGIFLAHAIVSLICIGISVYNGNFGMPGCGGKYRGFNDEEDDSAGSDSHE